MRVCVCIRTKTSQPTDVPTEGQEDRRPPEVSFSRCPLVFMLLKKKGGGGEKEGYEQGKKKKKKN